MCTSSLESWWSYHTDHFNFFICSDPTTKLMFQKACSFQITSPFTTWRSDYKFSFMIKCKIRLAKWSSSVSNGSMVAFYERRLPSSYRHIFHIFVCYVSYNYGMSQPYHCSNSTQLKKKALTKDVQGNNKTIEEFGREQHGYLRFLPWV